MSWCAVDVRTPAAERDRVAAWLVGRTGQAVEEREDGILVSATSDAGAAELLLQELRLAFGEQVATAVRTLPAIDWQTGWKAGLAPRRIGRVERIQHVVVKAESETDERRHVERIGLGKRALRMRGRGGEERRRKTHRCHPRACSRAISSEKAHVSVSFR